MSTPENIPYKRRFKKWQIVLIVIVAIGIVEQFTGGKSETSLEQYCKYQTNAKVDPKCPEYEIPSADISTAVVDDSWIPAGFSGYPDDDNLAWRWGTNKETDCTYSSGSCWSVMVVARDGCPSSLYAELKIFDSSDIQIDYTNDTTSSVSPMQKVKLTFDTFNDNASGAKIGELNCY